MSNYRVAIAIGSNLGDRHGHLQWAVGQLGDILHRLRASTFIETAPVDVPDPQPPYLNAAVVGETTLEPKELLEVLLSLERERGRERLTPRAARTLDLDIILFGDYVIDAPNLVIPHPRFRERRFVLEPLAQVAGEWLDPASGKTVRQLLAELQT